MHIGIDGRTLLNPLTGIGRYTYEVSKALLGITGVQESLYAPAAIDMKLQQGLEHAEIKVGRSRNRLAKMVWSQTQLPRWANEDSIDLFWGPTHRLPRFLNHSIPRVLTIHDLVWKEVPHTMRPLSLVVEKWLMPEAIHLADLVMADSQSTAEGISHYFPQAAHKVRIVHLGASKLLTAGADPSLDAFGITKPYFLFVGTIEPRKNIERLLQAFAALPSFYRDQFLLVIAGGKGWGRLDLEYLINQNQLRDCVFSLGFIDDEKLACLYSNARFLAMPSLYEGFGLPLLEAMNHGVPILTSQSGSMPEVAGNAAILVDPLSVTSISRALERLLSDDALIALLKKHALTRAKDFSWKKCAEQAMVVFEEAIALHQSGL